MSAGSIASSLEGQENYYITEHFTNTMALPYLMNRTHSVSHSFVIPSICLLFVQSTGPLIQFIQSTTSPLVHPLVHYPLTISPQNHSFIILSLFCPSASGCPTLEGVPRG